MKVSLVSSLHLDHSAMTMDHRAGDPIPLQSFVPMGLLCLKAYAEAHGVPAGIRVTDVNGLINAGGVANDEQFFARLAGAIKQPDDRLVGLMTDADSLHHTVVLAAELKRQDPQALICLGGPGSSPLAHDLLERFGCIDYVVRGEGEQTFAQLLEHLDADRPPTEVAGLSWRSATGAVLDNPARPVIRALDELPIPDLAAAGVTADSAVYLDVGRGCPFSCHFCATAPFWDRRYRMKSIDRILRELSLWHAAGRRHVTFSHDIFTCNRVWTRQFCERVVEAAPGVTWSCSTRTDTIDEELLELMAAAGCAEIYYGIETGSAAMQSTIHKNLDIERCRRIVAKTAAVGIRPVTGFIMGYPTETRETLADTLGRFFEFLEIGGHRAHLFTLCPFAEAPMYRDGHPIDRPAGYFEPPLLPSELAKAVEVASAHPDVFASLRRFAAPALPAQLIDASEEISSRLVVLKAIWPRLLPHYRDAFDWYERWVGWIGERNRVRRPGTRLPYTGEVDDVLDFVDAELDRLGLAGSELAVLARYERAKLAAMRGLPAGPSGAGEVDPAGIGGFEVGLDGWVGRSAPMRVVRLDGDLAAALTGRRSRETSSWIVLVRRNAGELHTAQVSATHAALLSRLAGDRPVRELLAPDESAADLLETLRRLIDAGLVRTRQADPVPAATARQPARA